MIVNFEPEKSGNYILNYYKKNVEIKETKYDVVVYFEVRLIVY